MWIGIGAASVALVITLLYCLSVLTIVGAVSLNDFFAKSFMSARLIEEDGIVYGKVEDGYAIKRLDDSASDLNVIYVPDEINGRQVSMIGFPEKKKRPNVVNLYSEHAERIYLPWSARDRSSSKKLSVNPNTLYFYPNVIFQLTSDFCNAAGYIVVPNAYPTLTWHKDSNLIHANIAYIFNYEDNPNEGYFFIDLIEETGKLTKPPYDPKRDGYTFDGWYKDEGCTEEWSFKEDEVIISFDEEDNRIYEEIKLYAKWTRD